MRHGAIKPERAPSGFRLYSEAEIERLKLLRDAVGAGHRISAIAGLGNQEIKDLLPETPPHDMASILERMRDAARNFDRRGLEQLLTREALALGPFEFCRVVVGPLLDLIGDAWSDTGSCMAEEHMTSATIRGVLMSLLRFGYDRVGGPLMKHRPLTVHHDFLVLQRAHRQPGEDQARPEHGDEKDSDQFLHFSVQNLSGISMGEGRAGNRTL